MKDIAFSTKHGWFEYFIMTKKTASTLATLQNLVNDAIQEDADKAVKVHNHITLAFCQSVEDP